MYFQFLGSSNIWAMRRWEYKPVGFLERYCFYATSLDFRFPALGLFGMVGCESGVVGAGFVVLFWPARTRIPPNISIHLSLEDISILGN